MLQAKTFEIRDKGTFFAAVGVLARPEPPIITDTAPTQTVKDIYLLRRSGYGYDQNLVLFGRLDGDSRMFPYDPYAWNINHGRTMTVAHDYVAENWDRLESGCVIDVEFILGETSTQKESEHEASV